MNMVQTFLPFPSLAASLPPLRTNPFEYHVPSPADIRPSNVDFPALLLSEHTTDNAQSTSLTASPNQIRLGSLLGSVLVYMPALPGADAAGSGTQIARLR